MSEQMRIGWIGTGVMGVSMAGHLLQAGYPLTVYTRTKSKAELLLARGAKWADSPMSVAQNAELVFSIVGYPKDVESVILGEQGVLQGLQQGCIVCDMTTSSPDLAKRIAEQAKMQNVLAMDAPVTGGDIGAKQASLSFFVGGEKEGYDRILPILQVMGKRFMWCGSAGAGQKAKLGNQIAVAGVMFSVCESMLFAQESGLDVRQWLELVAPGAGGSVAMNTLGRRLLNEDYAPGFFIEHFVKDLRLCLDECRRSELTLPGLALAEQFYSMMQNQGKGKLGTQSLLATLAKLSGKEWHRQP